ncbi:MAG: taurine dioxygenase, partial [Gammaproteobacteria bacterium]
MLHRFRHISVEPLTPAIGAIVSGVNIADTLSEDVVTEIRQAYLQYL